MPGPQTGNPAEHQAVAPDPRTGKRAGRLNRALRVLSAGNRCILRAADEAALLHEICRLIVEDGGYRLAFVGYAEHDEVRSIRPMACRGVAPAVLEAARLSWADTPNGSEPLGAVLRTGQPAVGIDLLATPQSATWRAATEEFGHLSASAFPLQSNGKPFGTLCIGAASPDAFDKTEAKLLEELATDLAYGIAALRARLRHKAGEAQLERVNRALRTLSAGNRCLLRMRTEQELLDEMCRVIVEEGGYPMAWVGYAQDDERKSIRTMAHAGVGVGRVEALQLTWADSGMGRGPTGTAVRTGQPVIGRNLRAESDPDLAQQRARILAGRGLPDYGAASVFPLHIDGEVVGNLSIYAQEPEAFDEAEARLLEEMAEDLGYGIGNLRSRLKRQEAEETIKRMAFHDDVTGLPNRLLLREQLEQAVHASRQNRRPLAVVMLRVEQFHEISDSLGYREGDSLLVEMASRLERLRGEDQILARCGEDEFVILQPGSGAAAASESARRLIAALYAPLELSGVTVNARVSIGIALCPGHGTDPDALLRRASMAAYEARRSASGHAVYVGSLDQDCTRRLALMGDLRRAIDHNELQLYCQPKVSFQSGAVCGAEALVRWPHPQLGMISTIEFIRLAEHAGLINPLTHWVLDAAFSQAYAWHEAGVDQPLAINLSAHDLRDPKLLDHVKGLFATWGVQPEWIQFELTESALMEDPAGTLETLTRLKKLDVELFIDDFGTGYSSLSYLQKLPVDSLKIDQSFVGAMIASKDSSVIVRSTIDLGHNLNLRIVAEGVESENVWERLSGLGCDTAQGYFVSKPIPAEQFVEWEQSSRWRLPGLR